jgi:Phage tail lysozyme
MAHGFLTPTPVSGDNFWNNVDWLWKKLSKKRKKKGEEEDPEKGGGLATTQKSDVYDPSVKAVRVTEVGSGKSKTEPQVLKMLKQSAVAGAFRGGTDNIVKKAPLALPPSGVSPAKGGTFTNIPGISAAPKKLDSEVFFKAAQTGVHPETGEYLSSDERREYLKKSKSKMNATASVAAGGASSITTASSIGEVTKGDEAIVGAVSDLSKIVTSLVDAVKAQTTVQQKIADREKASADRIANRALASQEEAAIEGMSKGSGTLTPTGGIGGLALGGGKSSNGLGGPALGVGGKVLAQAVGKRGVGRIGTRLAAKYGGKVAAKAAANYGTKAAAKLGIKGAAKIGGGAIAKSIGKKVPLLGLGLGSVFAVQRALKGDWLGAGLELASGAASTIPGLGTAGSVGLDAVLAARDMGATPFAKGGIITQPTTGLVGEAGKEGIFPLQGREGKKTFEMFGQGMIDAQKKNKRDYANLQATGLKQYYENQGGNNELAKTLMNVFKGLKDLFNFGGGGGDGGNGGDGGGDFSGSSGQDQAMNYFMSQGLTKEQAAGIVGNLMQESTAAIDPMAKNASGHRGIAQWDANRWGQFEKWAAKKGLDVNTREAQLQWIMEEMRTGSGGLSLKTLKGAKTAEQSAELVVNQYERSGETRGTTGFTNRVNNANALVKRQISGGPGTGAAQFGETGHVSNKGGWVHGHFQTNVGTAQDLVNDTAPIVSGLLRSGVTPELSDGTKFTAGMSLSDIKDLIKKGISQHGHSGDGRSVDIFVPKGTKVPFPLSDVKNTGGAGGVTGMLPGSGKVWVGHLDPRSKSGGSIHKPTGESNQSVASKPASRGGGVSPLFQPANANTGTDMMATSAQVSMGAMGLNSGGGNVTNIFNTGGQQANPIGNGLSAGVSSGGVGLSWMALRRR